MPEEIIEETPGEVTEQVSEGTVVETEEEVSIVEQAEEGVGEGAVKEKVPEVLPEESKAWWQNDENVSPGFKSEEEALKSIKEQRAWANRTQQENKRLKLRDEAFVKFRNGDIDESEIEQYVQTKETEFAEKIKKEKSDNDLILERVNMAVEVGRVRHPDIIIDENMHLINALAYTSDKETPLERLEDAVVAFKRIAGMSDVKKNTVKATQEEMKLASQTETPGSSQKETPADVWDKSSEDFTKMRDAVSYGV